MPFWRVYLVVLLCAVLCLYSASGSALSGPAGPLFRKLLHNNDPKCPHQTVAFKIRLKVGGKDVAYKYNLECIDTVKSPTLKVSTRASTHNGANDDGLTITPTYSESNDICCKHT